VVATVFAKNDSLTAEWFAPAGFNRGSLGFVRKIADKLTRAERDELYERRINSIAKVMGSDVAVFGQKTLQAADTALNRINARRLLIAIKKYTRMIARRFLFEQNTENLRARFLFMLTPYFDSLKQNQAIYDYRIIVDERNNTPDIIDANQLVGTFYIKPAKTIEFIILSFNIQKTSTEFSL